MDGNTTSDETDTQYPPHFPHRTPLHCAVAYSNRSAVDYLLTHGASLWLETEEEGDSALRLAERELQREEREEGELDAAQHCLDLLKSTVLMMPPDV